MHWFTRTITIAAPRATVFDFFLDFNQSPRWRQYVRTMEVTTPGPVRPGSVIHTTWDLGGSNYERDIVVAACERPSLWRHTVDEGDFVTSIEYRFDVHPVGTQVTMMCTLRPVGWYGWLAVPLLWLRRGQVYRDQLPQLKDAVEETTTRTDRAGSRRT